MRKRAIITFLVFLFLLNCIACNYFGTEEVSTEPTDSVDSSYTDSEDEEIEEQKEREPVLEQEWQNRSTISETLNHLAILVNFTDIELVTDVEDWSDYFYGEEKSVKHYFEDVSKGKLSFVKAKETSDSTDDGVIVVDVPIEHANLNELYDDDEKSTAFFEEVLQKADEYIDFSQYDKNEDEFILPDELTITIIAAGLEEDRGNERDDNSILGVAFSEEYSLFFDGVGINNYILTGELHYNYFGMAVFPTIGIACHELGHAMGLPDLYDTDQSTIGLAFHTLMAGGSHNSTEEERVGERPAPLDAWCMEFLGFVSPKEVSESGVYSLNARSKDDYNVIKIQEDGGYYLIENVDFERYGKGYEYFMELPGVAIWYIDEGMITEESFYDNNVNDNDDRRGVNLIEAGGTRDLYMETLDWEREDYNHYFSARYVNEYITEQGVVIKILDKPREVMDVEITFPSDDS